jgi:hypothetical protein
MMSLLQKGLYTAKHAKSAKDWIFRADLGEFLRVLPGTPWHRTPGQVCARVKCCGELIDARS